MMPTECPWCGNVTVAGQPYCHLCGESLSSNPVLNQEAFAPASVDETEVRLDHLAASDYILIETRRSVYRFTILDPATRYGVLSGGSLNGRRVHAYLLGALRHHGRRSISALTVGASAVFGTDPAAGGRQLLTSPILRLAHVRGGRPTQSDLYADDGLPPGGPHSATQDE